MMWRDLAETELTTEILFFLITNSISYKISYFISTHSAIHSVSQYAKANQSTEHCCILPSFVCLQISLWKTN